MSPCIRHWPPRPGAPSWELGQKQQHITLCNVLGSPVCCPQFLVRKWEKSPVVPQACGIHQSGRRFGSSLGCCGVISVPAMAGPALSPSQGWEQTQGPGARGGAAGTLLPPYAFAEPLPCCWPCWAAPWPYAHPWEGATVLSARSDVWHCSVPWEPAPGSQPHFAQLGSGEQGQVSPQRAATCAQGTGTRWCLGWQHAGTLALPISHGWTCFWDCSRHVPLAASMSPGAPMAEPVKDRGWQSAWWCGAMSS